MNERERNTSNFFAAAGALMFVSGILMAVSGRLSAAGVFWASANGMFLAARHFAKVKEQTKSKGANPGEENHL